MALEGLLHMGRGLIVPLEPITGCRWPHGRIFPDGRNLPILGVIPSGKVYPCPLFPSARTVPLQAAAKPLPLAGYAGALALHTSGPG